MRVLGLVAVVAAALLPASAWGETPQDVRTAQQGLAEAVAESRLLPEEAARFRAILARAAHAQPRLPQRRAANLAAVIADVSAHAPRYDAPRALALFSMLDLNTRRLAAADVPVPGADIQDLDGVVYRAFSGQGLQFHPLANFAKLNSLLAGRRTDEALALAQALLARGVEADGGLTWEYYFAFGGGKPPWTSGMAQAVAAQALARAGLLPEASLAFDALRRRLLMRLDGLEWVRLYSFSSLAVLNAQLQTALSVRDYGALAMDAEATDLASRLEASTAALLPAFDTGAWSLYAFRGSEASLGYHTYVVSLLRRLAQRSLDPLWRATAERYDAYTKQPPAVAARDLAFPAAYPVPRDGFRDVVRMAVTLSKLSTVTVEAAGVKQSFWVARGRRTIMWRPPAAAAAGTYPARLRAVDPAGNTAEVELPAIEIRRDTTAPVVSTARLQGGILMWSARDAETPWVRVRIELRGVHARRVADLGRRPVRGRVRVDLPRGSWTATLVASDSSANAGRARLGRVVRR